NRVFVEPGSIVVNVTSGGSGGPAATAGAVPAAPTATVKAAANDHDARRRGGLTPRRGPWRARGPEPAGPRWAARWALAGRGRAATSTRTGSAAAPIPAPCAVVRPRRSRR